MACKQNEVAILKGTSVKLNDNTIMILTCMYHTADKEAKKNGDKSWYRYEGRVVSVNDLKTEINDLKSDSKKLLKWQWPTKSSSWNKDWYLNYDGGTNNDRASRWFNSRLNKAITWPAFKDLAINGIKQTAKGPKSSPSACYDLDEYVSDEGQKFNIDNPETMAKLINHTFTKKIVLKRDK